MTTASGKKKTKFEYKLVLEENKFSELEFQDAITNKESHDLVVRDFDLRPYASELY